MVTLFKKLSIVLILIVFFSSCDRNQDTLSDINGSIDPTLYSISIGKLMPDDGVLISIPLEVFGGSQENLSGSTISLFQNGALISKGIDASSFYYSNSVKLYFRTTSDGATLGFLINTAAGSELYYEGSVSALENSEALTAVFSGSVSLTTGEVSQFFEDNQTANGDATGNTFSGAYTVSYSTMIFSSDCDATFLSQTGFEVSGLMSTEEISDLITNGKTISDKSVSITQTDASLIWEDSTSAEDFSGVINSDGSFTLFDGTYVNEKNYFYTFIEGSFDSAASTFTGTLTSKIELDGQAIINGYVGSCTASATFSGAL